MNKVVRAAVTSAVVAAVAVAGLAAVAAAGGGVPRPVPPTQRTVVLTIRHSRFAPGTVSVPVGTTVRFVVRNLDPIDHELIVGDAALHRRHEVGRDAHHHGDDPGEISVPAGTTASTTYTTTAPGRVLFACHLPGHFAYGMQGFLVVR